MIVPGPSDLLTLLFSYLPQDSFLLSSRPWILLARGSQRVEVQVKPWGPGEGWTAGNNSRKNRTWGMGLGTMAGLPRGARQPELHPCLSYPPAV